MPFYLRKQIKIAPGVRLNISKSGLGLSAGVRGARISRGPRGTEINLGRGGLYYRRTLRTRRRARPTARAARSLLGWQLWMGLALVLVLLTLSHAF
jgi:hypothetical protein